jgi:hypothetical protein
VTTTFLTKPADRQTLVAFYRLIRPSGPGWKPVQAEAGVGGSPDSMPNAFLGWVAGIFFVYGGLFGAGSFIYGKIVLGGAWAAVFVVSGLCLIKLLPKLWLRDTKPGKK